MAGSSRPDFDDSAKRGTSAEEAYSEEKVRQENHRLRKLKLETQKSLTLDVHKLKNDINTQKLENVKFTENLSAYGKVLR